MTDETRDERGQFAPEYADEGFLDAVRAHEPAGTSEVADAVGCTTQNADYRLRQLRDAGYVESKKVGRSLVWTLADDT
jgi:predicted transcriptional regulator